MDFSEINFKIEPIDSDICIQVREKWDNIAKPLRSLGMLEDMVIRLAGIQRKLIPDISRKAVVIFCSDNGIVKEGVTQSGCEVTASVAENFTKGLATVNSFSKLCGAEVIPVDIGICRDMNCKGLINHKIACGTGNIAEGAAMNREQFEKAVMTGIDMVKELKERGFNMIITGEMGIGNTAVSSALLSAMADIPPEKVTGRGAGLTDEGLKRKISAINKAIEVNNPDRNDISDIMIKLGGFDICAMAGCFIGGALYHIPVLIDGFISAVSANCAYRLAEKCHEYMFATHCSAEPAGKLALDMLDMKAPLDCGMRLGEGTGAVIGAKLFDFALAGYCETADFDKASVKKYEFLS